ncbi:MAG TPA: hypothetical protein VK094_07900 [Pseudogracilibacillus sp.]|nr:hypothetical protein [Pseudogracilibacillus sp.]
MIVLINTDIDQFTLVLQSKDGHSFDEWHDWMAMHIINTFLLHSRILTVFENFGQADVKLPEGYTNGFSVNNSPFYLCIAYNEAFSKMGVIVKFSAYAWHEYRKRYKKTFEKDINLHSFFKMIESDEYTFRLSRVDLYCDFINENINIAKLKRSLEEGRTEIRYGKY